MLFDNIENRKCCFICFSHSPYPPHALLHSLSLLLSVCLSCCLSVSFVPGKQTSGGSGVGRVCREKRVKNRNRIIQLSDFSVSGVWLPFARCTALMHATAATSSSYIAIAIAKNHSSIHNKSMTVDWQLADSRDVRRMDTWQKGRVEQGRIEQGGRKLKICSRQ